MSKKGEAQLLLDIGQTQNIGNKLARILGVA